jgi:predicted PurR-regulated permease PerM
MPDDPKPLAERRLWEFQALRDALVIAGIVGVLWLGARLAFITAPLLTGLGLAYLFAPVIAWLCARVPRMTRVRAVLALVAAVAVTGALLLALIVPPLVRQVASLAENHERYLASARTWATAEQRPAWLRERVVQLDPMLAQLGFAKAKARIEAGRAGAAEAAPAPGPAGGLDEARVRELVREELAGRQTGADGGDLAGRVQTAVKAIASGIAAVVGGIFSVVLFAVLTVVTAVACMLRWPDLLEIGGSLIPDHARGRVLPLVGRMDATVSSFIRGRLTVAAIVGCIYATGWTIVGVPYGLVLGLAVGACSVVPYLAAIGLPAAWGLLALSLMAHPEQGGWYVSAGADGAPEITWWLVLVLPWSVNFIAQSMEDYVLNPLIQGKATELHPVVIMLAVLAGGSLAGLYGMLLAVPVAACLKILLSAEIMPRLRRWAGAGSATP